MNAKKTRIISLNVDVITLAGALERITEFCRKGSGGFVCLANVHMVMEAYDDASFADAVNAADLVLPDGMPLKWMQRLSAERTAARIRGSDLMNALLALAEQRGLTVGFYGSEPSVIEAIERRLAVEFPALKVAYSYSPPFRPLTANEDTVIIAAIGRNAPDILFVGLGCPKQERWMHGHRPHLKAVMLGVGAAFDIFAGKQSEAPRWISRIGLEWLYRLLLEPKRLWRRYLLLNPRFAALAAMQLARRNVRPKDAA